MNKFICLFFLVILISSSLVPCCSAAECIENGIDYVSHEKGEEEGSCSPFSSCPGCVVSIDISDQHFFESPVNIVLKHNIDVQPNNSNCFLPGFWQPPRA